MSKKKTYRVVCPELDLVLFVKGYSIKEEQKLYESLRAKILKEETSIKIEDYKTFIVRKFLIDVESFFDELGTEDLEEMHDAVDYAYTAIVGLYPPFALEFICTDLNTDTFMSGVERKFLKHIRDQVQAKSEQGGSVSLSGIEDINNIEEYFKDNIIGQRKAIDAIVKSLKLMASGLSGHSSFMFVGPTGVGKTQVGKLLGEKFSGNFYKINCAEYAGGHEYAKLIGSPPGYVGHTEKSLLAEKAEESNQWVFLFDEIEKAHHKLYDFLLSLLDDGTCTDNMGTVLDFSESIFIFTSNQGIGDINRNPMGFDRSGAEVEQSVTDSVIRDSVKKHFSPEFLNRIDDIVVFNSLSKGEVKEIAKLQLEELPIIATSPLVDYIVENGFSPEYGARNIARFIKNNISDKIADAILNKLVPKNHDYYTPRIVKGKVKIINTEKYNVSSS